MSSKPESAWSWFKISLAALALTALIGFGLMVAVGVWAFWPIAGPEDVPQVRANAEPLINAIDRFTAANGEPPEKLDELVPEYITVIPEPLRGESCDFHYYRRAAPDTPEQTWEIVVFASGWLDLDSGREFCFDSKDRVWCFIPD